MTTVDDVTSWREYYESKAGELDEHAATYGSSVPLARLFYETRRNGVVSHLPAGPIARAVDLGCGIGEYLEPLAARAAATVAVDLAAGYLRTAVGRYPQAAPAQADAARLPFADASLDLLLTTEVIEHLERPTTLLDEVTRVVRPGGWVVISTPNPLTPHDLLYRVKRRRRGYTVNEHPGLMLPWQLRRALRRRGFEIEASGTCNFVWPYPLGDWLGRLPRQELVAEISRRIETALQRLPFARRCGWTTVVRARKVR